jgi:predicted SAM-dependent methyltransferase
MLKKSARLLTHLIEGSVDVIYGAMNLSINIGCGTDIKPCWVNCDLHPLDASVKKLDIKNPDDLTWLAHKEASLINCDHVIGYLTIAQAELFFRACYQGLKKDGRLILEFPDLKKLMNQLDTLDYSSKTFEEKYIEIIRAIYAYDKDDAKSLNFSKQTYTTGWTPDFLELKLREIGFSRVIILDPRTHGRLINRDTRVEAVK